MHLLKKIIVGALLSTLLIQPAVAQQSHEWKEAEAGGYAYRYVTNDPAQARFYTLKNGLSVILSPDKREPRIQTFIAVKAGSKTDPATHTGLAHYLEHMLFKGTDKFGSLDWAKEKPLLDQIQDLYEQYNSTTDEAKRKSIYEKIDRVSGEASKFAIANEYDKMMSNMGAQGSNAFTSFEQTVYVEDIPANAMDKYLAVQAERFRYPVFRIFHTELEAVYEEKNRGLDNDSRKSFEAMFATLFPNNNYGKQTTIGTVEHLKNPSLQEIRKYFNTYYVPNNMGIIMAGDFNPDEVIAKIDQTFGYMENKAIPEYKFDPEQPITAPIMREVYGPTPESIMLGFRFPGAATRDAQMLQLVGSILTNGAAGLIDLDLVKKQKLLSAYAFPYVLIDYSMLILQGGPVEGQSLDDVKQLILAELDKLKKGDFPDDLLTSIVNNEKKSVIEQNEKYSSRAYMLMDVFTSNEDWKRQVAYVDFLSSIKKSDIVAFANKYLNDNYVAVYKRQGEDKNIVKVEKPPITPVEVNREAQSEFLQSVNAMPENKIEPVWMDYQKDIQRAQSGPYELLAVKNADNSLFRINYYFDAGSWNDRLLPIAADYLNFIGTASKSSEDFSKDFYRLAASFDVYSGSEQTYVSLEGLDENFEASVSLFEDLLRHCQGDTASLDAYKQRLKKSRRNAKENKGSILRGLMSYAQYGAENPFNNVLTDAELDALTTADLINVLRNLTDYPHKIVYYGPRTATQVASVMDRLHPAPKSLKSLPAKKDFVQQDMTTNKVYFAHYDMVQAEINWVRNAGQYNAASAPTISLFNEYFGGGMGSIVFQTIRESKALAYSTYAYFAQPQRREYRNYMMAYVGTQSDKLNESIYAMNELITTLPTSEKALENAQEGLAKSLATDRVMEDKIIFSYLTAQRLGNDHDMRRDVYTQAPKLTYEDLAAFHKNEISGKPYAYCIVADETKVKEEDLKKYGELKKLNLEELFGY